MPLRRNVRKLGEQTEVLASMDVGAMWNRMLGEYLGQWEQLERRQLPPAEMEAEMSAFLEALSEKPVEELARGSTAVAYNQGRSAEMLSRAEAGEMTWGVRSALFDGHDVCAPCEDLDGEVYEVGSDEYHANTPPAKCLGGERCLCYMVPIAGEEAA